MQGVHCSFGESVYTSYENSKGSDGTAVFSLADPAYNNDQFNVTCSPSGGYILCTWVNTTTGQDKGSKEYILGP